jgi:EmrB/QacA subfamily drug resistance transporter
MARKWWALSTVCLGMLMLLVDITIVNVALPSIASDLDASFSDLQWTIDAYALSLAALMLVAGSLGDLLGHRRVFGLGLVVFSVASLLCGLAPDALFLILCRAAQGVGGAAMFAASLALLANEFKGRERGIALGIWGATAGASVAIGPLIGGALTSGISWRWVFYVNVPVGALTLALLAAKVAETRRRSVRPDWAGAVTFAGSLFLLVFALIRGNADGWSSTNVVTSFVAGGILLAVFVAVEVARREPMLDLRLLRNRTFLGASLAAVALSASLYSLLLYVTLYLQNILGYSPFQAGLRFLPLTLLVLVAAPIAGRLSTHVPLRLLLGAGLTLVAIGIGLMTEVGPSSGWTALLAGFVLAGIGSGLSNPPRASAALGSVPEEKAGVGSGVNNTALQVGLAAGIAVFGAVFQSRVHDVLSSQLAQAAPQLGGQRAGIVNEVTSGNAAQVLQSLPPTLREPVAAAVRTSFVNGLDRILWIAAVISLVGAVLSLLLVRQRDLDYAASSSRIASSIHRPASGSAPAQT